MEKFIMLEISVKVNSSKDVNEIFDNLEINVEGKDVENFNIENYFEFEA